MWSRPIEIRNIGTQHTMQLFLMEDRYMVKALSPNTSQKTFTNRIGPWCMIGRFENLDAARCCNTSETRSKLAIVIADEVLRRVSIRSRLPQLLCGPSVGRSARHTNMDDPPRSQFDNEEGKKRAKEEIGNLEKVG